MNISKEERIMSKKKERVGIIFEDDAMVIVYKPSNTLSIPDRYNPDDFNLKSYLKRGGRDIFVVHRLDRETSGIMCFAKTKEAHRHISQQFNKRTVVKKYHAIVEGQLVQTSGSIELPIGENPHRRGTMMVDHRNGKKAHTDYQLLEQFQHFALLELTIHTGRTHQIRVHVKEMGYPLAVDAIYGRRKEFLLSEVKKHYNVKKMEVERPIVARSTLHAFSLELAHPESEERMHFEAPYSKDMAVMLKQLKKYDQL